LAWNAGELFSIESERDFRCHEFTIANRAGEKGVASIKDSLPKIASVIKCAEPGAKPIPAPS
jgi:hypothetical protein